MKKLVAFFLLLLVVFTGMWTFKSRTPKNRPNSYADGILSGNYWWNAVPASSVAMADTDWVLDPEIPKNYIPVPGRENLYMVVDDDGYITSYRRRVRQEDGSWLWEEANPDIPENYEPVPGLKDVYKVTYDDGTVKYFKYIRNKDDTYAFVEVDARGNPIGEETPSGDTIPDNYERVNRNQYSVKNKNGVVIGYKERKTDQNGNVVWVNIDEPTVSTPSLPDVGFDLSKDVTGLGDTTGGVKPIVGYTGWITGDASAMPTLMPSGVSGSNTQQNPTFTFGQQTIIQTQETVYITPPPGMNVDTSTWTQPQVQTLTTPNPVQQGSPGNSYTVTDEGAGYYTETEVITETKQEGTDIVTYQQTVTRKYDSAGNLIVTNKTAPQEVARKQTQPSSVEAIASTLKEEQARIVVVLGSAGASYNANVPNDMHKLLNDARLNAGVNVVSFTGTSKAYQLALCRAAMMAIYSTSKNNLPQYGTLKQMCAKYGVSAANPSENMLITTVTSADIIHSMLMSEEGSRSVMLSSSYNEVGIAIVQKDGKFFIDEVFLK